MRLSWVLDLPERGDIICPCGQGPRHANCAGALLRANFNRSLDLVARFRPSPSPLAPSACLAAFLFFYSHVTATMVRALGYGTVSRVSCHRAGTVFSGLRSSIGSWCKCH
jgi:hypothetical protein